MSLYMPSFHGIYQKNAQSILDNVQKIADPPTDYIALCQLMRSGSIKVVFYLLPPQLLYVHVGQANSHIFAALEGVIISAPKEEHVSEAKPLTQKFEKI
jgi:hypothetical protein